LSIHANVTKDIATFKLTKSELSTATSHNLSIFHIPLSILQEVIFFSTSFQTGSKTLCFFIQLYHLSAADSQIHSSTALDNCEANSFEYINFNA
jgi:hypothetical protein